MPPWNEAHRRHRSNGVVSTVTGARDHQLETVVGYVSTVVPLLTSGHLLCRDTILIFYHVTVPLMRGHLVITDNGQDVLVFIPC